MDKATNSTRIMPHAFKTGLRIKRLLKKLMQELLNIAHVARPYRSTMDLNMNTQFRE